MFSINQNHHSKPWSVHSTYPGPGYHESWIKGVWNSILYAAFPLNDGYLTGPGPVQGGEKVDLLTAHYVRKTEWSETKFLVVKFKASGEETNSGVWEEAVGQLVRYLGATNERPTHRVYGVVAIGRLVRFYEFVNGQLADLHGDGTAFYLDRQCKTITEKMEYIRKNH